MKFQKVAPRYSKALFLMEGSKEQRLEHLQRLLDIWNKEPEFQSFLSSPSVEKSEKIELLKKAVGDEKDKDLWSFFNLVVESNRCNVIPAIIEDFRKRVIQSLNILEVTLSTAVPIEAEQKEKIKEKLEQQYSRKVTILEKIDSSIIGGVVLAMGDKLLDFSIKGRLETLRKQLCQ